MLMTATKMGVSCMSGKRRISNNDLLVFFQNSLKEIPIADAGFLFGMILGAKMDTTTL